MPPQHPHTGGRLRDERGLTLTELLIVLILFLVLLAVAIPAYLSYRTRANENVGRANIRAIAPAIEAYGYDNDGYAGMAFGGPTGLESVYDSDLKGTPDVTILAASATTYCVRAGAGVSVYYQAGPGADITGVACP